MLYFTYGSVNQTRWYFSLNFLSSSENVWTIDVWTKIICQHDTTHAWSIEKVYWQKYVYFDLPYFVLILITVTYLLCRMYTNKKVVTYLYLFQPSWRHLPTAKDTMVAYRTSDIQMNWQHPHKGDMGGAPLTCGYVKEGLGKLFTLTTSGME